MSGSIDSLRKIMSSRKSKESERQQQLALTALQSTPSALNDRVVIDKQGTTVAITVKTKGHKTTPKMPKTPSTSTPETENQIERKKRSSVLTENKSNWPGTFREQTKVSLKQSLQQINGRMSGSKTARASPGDYREPRRLKSDTPSVLPSTISLASRESTESVIVTDKGVQCGGLFASSNNHFDLLNPIRTIDFLIKELRSLVNDDKSNTILFQMEQALMRVPSDVGKSSPADLEAILKHTQLEASVVKLAAAGKEMQMTAEAMRKEKTNLLQQLDEKTFRLEASLRREAELEALVKDLRQKLSDSSKLELTNKKLLNELKEKNEKIQLLQNITTELKTELNEQTELAQQRFLDCQFLKMEKEKLSVMSSFKDSQLVEHRKAIKNLQNLIGDQLSNIKKASRPEDLTLNPDENLSLLLERGRASSSPVRSSNNSVVMINNGHDVVDVSEPSISTIDVTSPPTMINKNMSLQLENLINGSEYQMEKFKEKTHLEFTSIGGDEGSTQTASLLKPGDDEFIYIVPERIHDLQVNENEVDREKGEVTRSKEKSSMNARLEESKGIRKEIQMMYENTRINSKVEVRVPSPPRNYPHPDWSDSSLPTMSISESNVI